MAYCSKSVSSDGWHYRPCTRTAICERGGKPYCKQHDPEYIKQKDAEKSAKRNTKRCPKCRAYPETYWRYCTWCGTKLPSREVNNNEKVEE